jgi:predicted nucleic acid-binding protein
MKAYFDTNVLVAAVQPDHVHHSGSFAAYVGVTKGEIAGHIASQSLAELYSVLTRAPVTPQEILALIQNSIVPHFTIVDVTTGSYLAAIAACANAGWRGGRIHDMVHIQAAAQAKCDRIYTYDLAHFQALAPDWGDRIQSPPRA